MPATEMSRAMEVSMHLLLLDTMWPQVPEPDADVVESITVGDVARLTRGSADTQDAIRRALHAGRTPIIACMAPGALTPEEFRAAWCRLVTEGQGRVAWAVKWLLAEATDDQRAALTHADYLACLSAPAGDVRFLGQQFLTETYQMPAATPVTRTEKMRAAARALAVRLHLAAPPARAPWSLPAQTPPTDAARRARGSAQGGEATRRAPGVG